MLVTITNLNQKNDVEKNHCIYDININKIDYIQHSKDYYVKLEGGSAFTIDENDYRKIKNAFNMLEEQMKIINKFKFISEDSEGK